jgi:hypothetical protein
MSDAIRNYILTCNIRDAQFSRTPTAKIATLKSRGAASG